MEQTVDDVRNETPAPVRNSLLTVKDVVNLLPLSSNHVYLMAASGRIPCIRIGAKLYFKREVIEFIRQYGTNTCIGVEK